MVGGLQRHVPTWSTLTWACFNSGFASYGIRATLRATPACVRRHAPQYCPWKDHLYDLEKDTGCVGQVLFCVYQDERDKSYRVQVSASARPAPEGQGLPTG